MFLSRFITSRHTDRTVPFIDWWLNVSFLPLFSQLTSFLIDLQFFPRHSQIILAIRRDRKMQFVVLEELRSGSNCYFFVLWVSKKRQFWQWGSSSKYYFRTPWIILELSFRWSDICLVGRFDLRRRSCVIVTPGKLWHFILSLVDCCIDGYFVWFLPVWN